MKNRKNIHIEWGDCDPAQIVYFPRYFEYFDACTTALFRKAGLVKSAMLKKYGIVGIPLVDVRATFHAPSRFDDDVVIESEFVEVRRSSFVVRHRLLNRGTAAVECIETHVWARRSGKNPGAIEGAPIPPEVAQKLAGKKMRTTSKKKER
ncbi:MAG: acyl-CoA thioesterase [Candidatus Sulfotelmatobacter sp.]